MMTIGRLRSLSFAVWILLVLASNQSYHVMASEQGSVEGDILHPYAVGTELYGYFPVSDWSLQGRRMNVLTIAYLNDTSVRVIELPSRAILGEGMLNSGETLQVMLSPGKAFKVEATKPASALFRNAEQMEFVPSLHGEGTEFLLPGVDLESTEVTIFAWDDAHIVIENLGNSNIVWDVHLPAMTYAHPFLPGAGRTYRILSSAPLTVERVNEHDSSAFVPDRDQDGVGRDFLAHLKSWTGTGRGYLYSVHAFEDAQVQIFDWWDPDSPVTLDTLSLLAGETLTRVIPAERPDEILRVVSSGDISLMAGALQRSAPPQGIHDIGDDITSVPSKDGRGLDFLFQTHTGTYMKQGGTGAFLVALHDGTEVSVEGPASQSLLLDREEWTWISSSQPATTGTWRIVSSRPIVVMSASVGGDDDLDNVATFLSGPVAPRLSLAELDCDPNTLNLKSNGRWVTCYLTFKEGQDPRDVNPATVRLNSVLPPVLDAKYGFVSDEASYIMDHDGDGVEERMMKFDRKEVEAMLEPGDEVEMHITGELFSGIRFEGSDYIRVIREP